MFRILHLADLHLGWEPRFMAPDRAAERRRRRDRLLARAVDYALEASHQVGLVLIAGDLFETHRPPESLVQEVISQLRRLEAAGVPVVTVPGNHDEITYHDSVYRRFAAAWPGVLVQNPLPEPVATLAVAGFPVHIYSLAYTGGVTPAGSPLTAFPRLDEPGLHVAVFHGTLGHWGGDRSLPLDREALARAGYDYVALGHIHQALEERLGRTPAVYAGAVEGKGFDDPGTGAFTLVEVEPGRGVVAVRREPVPVQPVETLRIDAGTFGSAAELGSYLASLAAPDRILRLELHGTPAFAVDGPALQAEHATRFFHLEIHDATEPVSWDDLLQWSREPTITGLFVRRLLDQLEGETEPRRRRVVERALRLGVQALMREGQAR
ncbi:DNA repair exonuclease [Thermaerobacter sp. PB12/4term]|uniref:metallophosphoesterase family protein n=1 Tax=Thermaerobacter sp. PB12/4term TaxID=2293838 RepID=UPI000E3287E1|nr:DNA repair exonuclease [Thermaerobacter sp. PB12/4term]QIA26775.1 DNA repair exonuclease [Thermaerobacter sp. PB12/4term]